MPGDSGPGPHVAPPAQVTWEAPETLADAPFPTLLDLGGARNPSRRPFPLSSPSPSPEGTDGGRPRTLGRRRQGHLSGSGRVHQALAGR